jgi:hypothetical protein
VWTFNLSYAAAVSDVIGYFIAAQEQSGITAVALTPSSSASSASDVNNVIVPPSPASSYTIQTAPTISVNNGTICAGESFTIVATGAANYTYSSGSAVVSPATNTFYTVTGSSAGGCAAVNTVTSTVAVNALPVLSVSASQQTICAGQSAVLSASGANYYTWQPAGVSGSQATVRPTSSTNYTVDGKDINGCTSSMAIAVTVTTCVDVGVAEHVASIGTSVYPNPNNGSFTINYTGQSDLVLYNELGQEIYRIKDPGNKTSLTIAHLNPGVYYLSGKRQGTTFTEKVIVLK